MQEYEEIVLPDLFSLTPFSWAGCNPFFSQINNQSTEWLLGYKTFTEKMRSRLSVSCIELCGANTYNYCDAKMLRVANDYIMITAGLDEVTEVQDPEGAKATRDTFVKALSGESVDDCSEIALIAKDFLATLPPISADVRKRLVDHTADFLDASADEAQLREDDEIPSFEKYTQIRRKSGVCPPLFDMIEVVLGITLPSELFEDTHFTKMYDAMNDMICITNDIYSFPVEYERGLDGSNVVSVLMKAEGLSAQGAMDEVSIIYKGLADTAQVHKDKIRSFGPENDDNIRSYIYGLEQWVCGHLAWYLGTKRYFGDELEEMKRTGIVRVKKRESRA